MKITGTLTVGDTLASLRERTEKPLSGNESERYVKTMRRSVDRDFRREGHHGERGFTPWKPTKPFGTRKIGPTLGGTTGSIAKAWQGGRGGSVRKRPDAVELVVSLPGIGVHRGGSGTTSKPGITHIKAKKISADGRPAMQHLFRGKYGVNISGDKLLTVGVPVPARPHATGNPQLAKELEELAAGRITR